MSKVIYATIIGAMFSMCAISQSEPSPIVSQLVILDVKTGKEKIVLQENRHFEAPNWSRNGEFLIINSGGLIEKVSLDGEKLGVIDTQFADKCNNDHGFSLDGKWLVISHNDEMVTSSNGKSRIFILPAEGGTPRLITPLAPSYWHGISPDAKWIVYCAMRNEEWDVYKADTNTGEEIRLTNAPGLDDGPEFSYDGEWIYFNSHRTSSMHLYRMRPDGSEQTQLTFDEFDNWFPHPSPDNKSVAYISYMEDQEGQHPFGKDVKIKLLDVATLSTRDLTPVFYGGQGTLNVHSWSPQGNQLAFVRYIK